MYRCKLGGRLYESNISVDVVYLMYQVLSFLTQYVCGYTRTGCQLNACYQSGRCSAVFCLPNSHHPYGLQRARVIVVGVPRPSRQTSIALRRLTVDTPPPLRPHAIATRLHRVSDLSPPSLYRQSTVVPPPAHLSHAIATASPSLQCTVAAQSQHRYCIAHCSRRNRIHTTPPPFMVTVHHRTLYSRTLTAFNLRRQSLE